MEFLSFLFLPFIAPKIDQIQPSVEISIPAPIVEPYAPQQATEPAKEEPPVFSSCVKTTRLTYPEAPLENASQYPLNGKLENSEIIILKYAKDTGTLFHIAPIASSTETEITLGKEGNFIKDAETNGRIIKKDAKEVVGYFDLDLWLKIKALPESAQKVIECESRYNHYKPDGSILRSDTYDFGLGQFNMRTWNWFNDLRKRQGLEPLYEIFDPYQQVEMIKWAWDNHLQNHWVCYNKLYEIK